MFINILKFIPKTQNKAVRAEKTKKAKKKK